MIDVLSVFFPFLLKDQLSLSSSICVWGSSALDFGPSKDASVSSGSSGFLVSLGLWLYCRICPGDYLIVFSKVCSFSIGLFSFTPILGFSPSPPPPHNVHTILIIYKHLISFLSINYWDSIKKYKLLGEIYEYWLSFV